MRESVKDTQIHKICIYQDMVDIANRLKQDCSGSAELHVVPSIEHAAHISVAKDRLVIASRGMHLVS